MPLTINGTSGLTFPDSTTQATRAVSRSGDTMTGALGINGSSTGRFGSGLSVKGTIPEVHLSRNDGNGDGVMLLDNNASSRRLFIGTSGTDPVHLGANGTTHIAIDSSGRVTMPLQPAFALQRNGSEIFYTTANAVLTGFNQAITNVGSHMNVSTGTFTAPIAGRYLFQASVWHNQSTSNQSAVGFFINGVQWDESRTHAVSTTSRYAKCVLVSIMTLAANDTVQLRTTTFNQETMIADGVFNKYTGCLLG